MSTIAVNVKRADQYEAVDELEADLQRARLIAKLLDSQFSVGGIQFGIDAILGLVPAAGDLVSALIGAYPIYVAKKHGLGKAVQVRMALNLATDWAVGVVPVVGDVADVMFKANIMNLKLLEKAVEKKRGER
jgi:hypothetical protein